MFCFGGAIKKLCSICLIANCLQNIIRILKEFVYTGMVLISS